MADAMVESVAPTVPASKARTRQAGSGILMRFLIYAILLIGGAISVAPFLWMISTSVMSLGEAQGVRVIPSELHLENYVDAWDEADFAEYFVNSVQIAVITLAGELVVCVLAAYAFAKSTSQART